MKVKHLDPTTPFFNDMIHVVLNSCTINGHFVSYAMFLLFNFYMFGQAYCPIPFVLGRVICFILRLYGMWTG